MREGPSSRVTAASGAAEIHLPETPSTGYRWHLDDPHGEATIVSTTYRDASATPVAGGAGVRVFQIWLDLTDRGEMDLTFLLRRPWEGPEQAVERRVVTVTT
jgi:predicted secreted protein